MKAPVRLLAIAAIVALSGSVSAWASTFNFYFDNNGFSSPLVPSSPIVGAGNLTLSSSVPDGVYTLSALPAFTMAFSFLDGQTYTAADIVSDPTQTEVMIYGGGTGAFFTDLTPQPPNGGSLNLVNPAGALLSLSPDYIVGFYVEGAPGPGPAFEGDYGNAVVPEPSSLMLMSGAGLMAGIILKRRRRVSSSIADCVPCRPAE